MCELTNVFIHRKKSLKLYNHFHRIHYNKNILPTYFVTTSINDILTCSTPKHLEFVFYKLYTCSLFFFLGVRATARNTSCFCSLFFKLLLLLLLPRDCPVTKTHFPRSHNLQTSHIVRSVLVDVL